MAAKLNEVPLQIGEKIVSVNAGTGLTVTIILNVDQVHSDVKGVTVYVARPGLMVRLLIA